MMTTTTTTRKMKLLFLHCRDPSLNKRKSLPREKRAQQIQSLAYGRHQTRQATLRTNENRVWSPRQAISGAQILSSRNPPVDQIHNLTSCFDDLSTKRCSEDVTDKKAENESPAWTIRLCDVGWRGHQSIEIKIYEAQDPKNKDENTPTSWQM